jgi:Phytanoyl-CoA dioxygenase (PhyH)
VNQLLIRQGLNSLGYLKLEGFIDVQKYIAPIWVAIHQLARLICQRRGLDFHLGEFSSEEETSDELLRLTLLDRAFLSDLYDASKQIPAFLRLASCTEFEDLYGLARQTDLVGIGERSYGIRYDLPDEDLFRSHWHQEYASNPQSQDGLVYWIPLVPMAEDMGSVVICEASNRDGFVPHEPLAKYAFKSGLYQTGIPDEDSVVARYRHVSPLSRPGDLLLMDFRTIHQSGYNRSRRLRVTMQVRYFNFTNPEAVADGWPSSPTEYFGYPIDSKK